MENRQTAGFTLIEVMVTVVILALLAAAALPVYSGQMKKGRLTEAAGALQENAQFLERHYMKHGQYRLTSTKWPDLPRTGTQYFTIGFSSQAKGEKYGSDRYILRAQAKPGYSEERYLELDHHGNMRLCRPHGKNSKRCEAFKT